MFWHHLGAVADVVFKTIFETLPDTSFSDFESQKAPKMEASGTIVGDFSVTIEQCDF